uniref:Uncharacterized protein n=1 Tax=Chrysotila carterae TaxID=13221 RepID=A0A7S4B582_CHRCT
MAAIPPVNTVFERKEYDVTDNCAKCCAAITIVGLLSLCDEQRLVLEPEEAVLTKKTLCDTNVQRRPYGELGSVDKATSCGCCAAVSSNLGPISPGFGCEAELVDEIVEELKKRMKTRGDTGQIQRAEQQLHEIAILKGEVANVNAKLDAVLQHLNIAAPQPQKMM